MDNSLLEKIKSFCAYQERSHTEVRHKLIAMEIYGLDLENYLTILIEENFLSEERFAIAYAGGKFRMKHWGRIKIKHGLKQHQVSDYCIRKSLEQIEEDSYLKVFLNEAEKKWESLRSEKNIFTKKGKLKNYMLQKGFEQFYIYEFLQGK